MLNSDHLNTPPSYRYQPCPDCPDNCAENDLRNNEAFQCLNMDERLRDPNSPESNPPAHVQQILFGRHINPLPDSVGEIDPRIASAVAAGVACVVGNKRATEMGDGCGTRMQPTPDNPDCAPLMEATRRGAIPNPFFDPSLCSQINCDEDRTHPCCGNPCLDGEELAPGPRGPECQPRAPNRGPTGPSPEGAH